MVSSQIALLVWISALIKEEMNDTTHFIMIATVVPTLTLAVSYCMASKLDPFTQLHGPLLLGAFSIAAIVIEAGGFFKEIKILRVYLMGTQIIYVLLYMGLLSADFLPHFLARSILFTALRCVLGMFQVLDNESEVMAMLLINIPGWLIAELIFYVQLRAQAKLFLAGKVTAMQQEQLQSLLDSVPDKVLICSNIPDSHTPKPLYLNK